MPRRPTDLQNDANGKVEPGVLDTYGWVLVLCGGDDASRGIDMLKQAIQENDHLIEAECHLGEAYMRMIQIFAGPPRAAARQGPGG